MPKQKQSLTMENPPETTSFYGASVKTKTLKKVDALRNKNGQTIQGAVEIMMQLYLTNQGMEEHRK